MENRTPESADAVVERSARRLPWLLLAGAVLVIVLVLVSATRLFAPGNADPWREGGEQTFGQATPPAQDATVDQPPATTPQGALIIDERDASLRSNPLARIQPAGGNQQPGHDDISTASDGATARTKTPSTATARTAAATPAARSAARSAARAARAAGTPATGEHDGDLFAALMRIIRQDDAGAPIAGTAPTASTRAQRELQDCPAANTVQGINCRDRVCASYAGRDPACPAR